MKLTFVTPRYGSDIVGGAEHAVGMLAENVKRYSDVEVDILSTTAGDERTWSKKYSAGKETINGVEVTRFDNDPINRPEFDSWATPLLNNPSKVTRDQFDQWLKKQGPYSPGLLEAIGKCDSDAIVFHPMLSSPTGHGVFSSKKPVILHPALHDEPLSYMPGYKKVVERADLLAFSTRAEQSLSHKIHGSMLSRQSVIGFGIDDITRIDSDAAELYQNQYGLKDHNYAVVIGRVDDAKGSGLLAKMFLQAKNYINSLDNLVYIGPISPGSQVQGDGIIYTDAVSDEEKWALLSNARCLISPSWTESFSLVVLEAMKLGIPVIVNGRCAPTREHVERSNAGAWFENFIQLCSSIDICSLDSQIRDEMIKRAKVYVDNFYNWESLIGRYIEVVSSCVCLATN